MKKNKRDKKKKSFFRTFAARQSGLYILFITIILFFIVIETLLRLNIVPFEGNYPYDYQSFMNSDSEFEGIGKTHKILGHTLKENLRNVSHAGGKVSTNSQGFRGTKEYSLNKPDDTTRIVNIGDSFAFGECVNDDETYSAYLENMRANTEAMNLGVFAYGTDQAMLRLELDGLKYNPDIIIFGFVNADIDRNRLSFAMFPKPRFKIRNGELMLSNTPLQSPDEFRMRNSLLLFYLRGLPDQMFRERVDEQTEEVTYHILKRIVEDGKKKNAEVVFLYLPFEAEVLDGSAPHPLFYQICEEENIVCLDPTKRMRAFLKDKEDSHYYFDCKFHYQKEIHKVIAQEINEYLDSRYR